MLSYRARDFLKLRLLRTAITALPAIAEKVVKRSMRTHPPDARSDLSTWGARLTVKQERFALLVAQGRPLSAAYRQAYNTASMAAKTVHEAASRLAHHCKITARIDALRAEIEARTQCESDGAASVVINTLLAIMEDPTVKPRDRLKASELLGRIRGVDLFGTGPPHAIFQRTPAGEKPSGGLHVLSERIKALGGGGQS